MSQDGSGNESGLRYSICAAVCQFGGQGKTIPRTRACLSARQVVSPNAVIGFDGMSKCSIQF